MIIADKWLDYKLLYAGGEEKYEQWGDISLLRPDPQAIWPVMIDGREAGMNELPKPHAVYSRSSTGGGSWNRYKPMPANWQIGYDSLGTELRFIIEPTGFKHTGLFPEQAANWDFCGRLIRDAVREGRDDIRILNLFAYTGGATCACAAHGAAEVVHVDASRGMIARAKENVALCGLSDKYVRFIAEDCRKFVERELRRGRKYDGIIMDPPKYGRGPTGELWELGKALNPFVRNIAALLSDEPLFVIINSYATDIGAGAVANVLKLNVADKYGGYIESDELGLPICNMDMCLPCGQTTRWSRD